MRNLIQALALVSAFALVAPACGDKAEEKKEDSKKDDAKKDDKKDRDKKDPATTGTAAASGTPTAAASAAPTAAPVLDVPSGRADALGHIPAGCEAVLSVDIAKIAKHRAVSKDIVPRLETLASAESKDPGVQRFQSFSKETGFKLQGLGNLGLCVDTEGGGEPLWTVLIGSDLKSGSFVPALEKAMDPAKKATLGEIDGVKTISDGKGTFVQFADGVIGIAPTADRLKASLKPGADLTAYKLDRAKELSFFLGKALITSDLAKKFGKASDMVKDIEDVTGSIDLPAGKVQMTLRTASADGAKTLDALVTLMKAEFSKDKRIPAQFGLLEAVKSIAARIDGNNVILEMTFPAASIDEAVKLLATQIDAAIKK